MNGGGININDEGQDPTVACTLFAERLIQAADVTFVPVEASLNRSAAILGGLHVKTILRAIANALAQFTKLLTAKVEELRVACGLQSDQTDSQTFSPAGKLVGEKTGLPVKDKDKMVSSTSTSASNAIAESWARRLELQDGVVDKLLVPCALRALQSAGRLSRHVRTLESIASGLLMEISENLALTSPSASSSLEKILSSTGSGDLDMSIGACYALYTLQQDTSATSELKSFLSAATSSSHSHGFSMMSTSQTLVVAAPKTIFSPVAIPLSRLKSVSGALFFDLCITPPDKILTDLHLEDVWASPGEPGDNLLPQQAVTQVGEHLLSLVQELELFASSDALPDLLHLSGEAQALAVASRGWRKMRITLDLRGEAQSDGIDNLCKRPSCSSAITVAEKVMFGTVMSKLEDVDGAGIVGLGLSGGLHTSNTNSGLDGNSSEAAAADEEAAMAFVNEWLGAVTDATWGLLLGQLIQIKRLSVLGRAQMAVDLDYVANVIHAMGLKHHPLLVHLREAILGGGHDPRALASLVESMPARSAVSVALQRLDSAIVKATL